LKIENVEMNTLMKCTRKL